MSLNICTFNSYCIILGMNILNKLRLIYIVLSKIKLMQKQIFDINSRREAMSPVLGVVLMLFLTILLAGITISSVYGGGIASSLVNVPMALIEVEYVEGGMPNYPNYVRYEENFLYLKHMGGDPLPADSTQIVITGEGSSYEGVVPHGTRHYGQVFISYDNLLFDGKIPLYASRNADLSDGVWSAGEELVLNGDDSINGGVSSSVSVSINGIMKTSNNYGLKESNMATIKIFDSRSKRIIFESECLVVLAD